MPINRIIKTLSVVLLSFKYFVADVVWCRGGFITNCCYLSILSLVNMTNVDSRNFKETLGYLHFIPLHTLYSINVKEKTFCC